MKLDILQQATIFKAPNLSKFQEKVNAAASELALTDPYLVRKGNRGILLECARKKVCDDGFIYKKGKSRSKLYGEPSSAPSSDSSHRREKLNEEMRRERIGEIEEDIESIASHLAIKERRLAQAETVRNYKLCDALSEQIQELKELKRAKVRELAILQQKEKRAKRYRDSRDRFSTRSRSHTPASSPMSPPTLALPRTTSSVSPRIASPISPRATSPGSPRIASPIMALSSPRMASPLSPRMTSPVPLSPRSPTFTEDGCTNFLESAPGPSRCQNLL